MNLVSKIERVESDLRMRIRSRRNRRTAADALASIQAAKGRLPRCIRAQADYHAVDVLGSRRFAPWLYVYSAIGGEFREGWIPDGYYLSVMLAATKGRYNDLSEMRSLSTRIFGRNWIPDRGYVVRRRLVHVLEWNSGHNDIKFSEATSGPCFRGLGWEHLGRHRRGHP